MPLLIIMFIVSFLVTKVAVPRFSQMLHAGGAVKENFTGKQIPVATGIAILAAVTVSYFLAVVLSVPDKMMLVTALAVILSMGILGLVDDLLGTRDTTGIKGHLSMLWQGKLTTGGLKALGGGGLALGFSLLFSPNIIHIAVNTLNIALFTNAINLTDLRPGRACKAFLIIGFVFLAAGFKSPSSALVLLAPVYGAVLAFLPFDLKAQVMMGDTGSNVLGITLGMTSVFVLTLPWKLLVFALLILLHLYTEKYSLTETIKRVTVLRLIDEWGTLR